MSTLSRYDDVDDGDRRVADLSDLKFDEFFFSLLYGLVPFPLFFFYTLNLYRKKKQEQEHKQIATNNKNEQRLGKNVVKQIEFILFFSLSKKGKKKSRRAKEEDINKYK